jgi:hypothetical protein
MSEAVWRLCLEADICLSTDIYQAFSYINLSHGHADHPFIYFSFPRWENGGKSGNAKVVDMKRNFFEPLILEAGKVSPKLAEGLRSGAVGTGIGDFFTRANALDLAAYAAESGCPVDPISVAAALYRAANKDVRPSGY